jgi:ribosome-binding protein aMBF1 (putative translation factor)
MHDFGKVSKKSNVLSVHKSSRIDSFLDFDDYLAEKCKDPEYKRLFDREFLILDLANIVARARKRLALTQSELALKAQTTQPVIARLEGGRSRRMPSLDLLAKIAAALGCKLKIGFDG